MNNIDRLFSDALQEHTTPAPAGLWERVESAQPVTDGGKTWLRWAAILIPALVAAGIWMSRPDEASVVAVAESNPAPVPPPKTLEPLTISASIPQKEQKSGRKPVQTMASLPIQEPSEIAVVEEVLLTEELTIEPVVLDPEPTVSEPEPAKPIVIVYTLETVAAPDDAEKETSLDRVVDFARAVKHSDPIGDIRGLKDELFAFDFRKKQTKKN